MNKKIRVGITHGDVNGVGYEVILKSFMNVQIFDMCTPILYGSPKVAAYQRKTLDISTNFTIITKAEEAEERKLNVLNCVDDELLVEFGKPDKKAGKAAFMALEKAVEDYKAGLIDVIVTAPIDKNTIHSEEFEFPGHTEFFENRLGMGQKSLMILMKDDFRIALTTVHIPLKEVPASITKELIQEKLDVLEEALRKDFNIAKPRIAVFSLNPHSGDSGLLGSEEQEVIIPALADKKDAGMLCYGPYAADGFMGSGNFTHFDGILAMYHDQGLAPFKALARGEGVNYTAGLPVIRTSPAHGTAYDIAGKGDAQEDSFRQAIYAAIDIFRNRSLNEKLLAESIHQEANEDNNSRDRRQDDKFSNQDIA